MQKSAFLVVLCSAFLFFVASSSSEHQIDCLNGYAYKNYPGVGNTTSGFTKTKCTQCAAYFVTTNRNSGYISIGCDSTEEGKPCTEKSQTTHGYDPNLGDYKMSYCSCCSNLCNSPKNKCGDSETQLRQVMGQQKLWL